MDEFERLKILVGPNIEKIKNLSVLVLGVGGVGSFTVESLVRSGIKKIIIVDNDIVDITNINRQLIALHSTIGEHKVDVLEKRIKDISKTCEVIKIKQRITLENIDILFKEKVDFIVDACDTIEVKKELLKCCLKTHQKLIMSMGTANKLDPTKLNIMDLKDTSYDPIAKILRKYVKDEKLKGKIPVVASIEQPIKTGQKTLGSTSFVPSVAGLLITSYIINEVIKHD